MPNLVTHANAIAIINRWRLAITTSKSQAFPAEITVKSKCRNHENRIGSKKSLQFTTYSEGFPDPCGASEKFWKPHKTGGSRVQRVGFRGCFRSRNDFFELRLQSLAICDFEVAAIRVTKHTPEHREDAKHRSLHGFLDNPFLPTGNLRWPRAVAHFQTKFKNLLMPLFLMGCFPVDFRGGKRPLRTKSGKRPIKVGKRPINEGKRPIKAKVLVGVSVGCLMGCFRAPSPWRKTAPLKGPIKRSMRNSAKWCRIVSRNAAVHSRRKAQEGKEWLCPNFGHELDFCQAQKA